MEPKPTIGRIVHYTLSESDAEQINRRRTTGHSIKDRIDHDRWPLGAQAHIGNPVFVGQVIPAVVVNQFGDGSTLNLHCLLDGNDTFWALSRLEGGQPGNWCWPPRV